MALFFADPAGLIYGSAAQALTGMYSTTNGSGITTSGLPAGAVGTTAINTPFSTNFGGDGWTILFPTATSPGPFFFGGRFITTGTLTSNGIIATFLDNVGGGQILFTVNTNGTINARVGSSSGTILGVSANTVVITTNVWCYLEFGVTISSTVGTVDIRINGTSVLHLTGQNTLGTANVNASSIRISNAANPSFTNTYWQDLYLCDNTGAHNNTFLGDVHVSAYQANANGTFTAYTPNGAASIWQSVTALVPLDTTIFASDSTVGDKMSVTVAPSSVAGSIAAVVVVGRMQKSSSGSRQAATFALNGGVEVDGATQSLGTSYKYYLQVVEVDPNTGNTWLNSGFNTAQFGVKTVS